MSSLSTHFYACQFRDILDISLDFTTTTVLHRLLSVPHFHYLNVISDIWLLVQAFDSENGYRRQVVAWAYVLPWNDTINAIHMIDTFERGHNYAQILINHIEDKTDKELLPYNVIPSAEAYWERYYDRSCWLSGHRDLQLLGRE